MDFSKLRTGELIAAVGGLVLLVAMFAFDWYEISGFGGLIEQFGDAVGVDTGIKAWDGQGFLGTIANLVILAAAVAAVALAILTATSRTVALPVAASAITAGLGIGAVVMVLLRMVFQPGPNEVVDLRFGIFLALIGAAMIAYGGWQSMQEEGTSFEDARDQLKTSMGTSDAPPAEPVAPAGPPRDEPPPEPGDTPGPETLQAPASSGPLNTAFNPGGGSCRLRPVVSSKQGSTRFEPCGKY